jgi:hypothetical protein
MEKYVLQTKTLPDFFHGIPRDSMESVETPITY